MLCVSGRQDVDSVLVLPARWDNSGVRRVLPKVSANWWAAALAIGLPAAAGAQPRVPIRHAHSWRSFAGNPQHTAVSPVAAQSLARIRWQTPVDLDPELKNGELVIHYGSPLITAANTVI